MTTLEKPKQPLWLKLLVWLPVFLFGLFAACGYSATNLPDLGEASRDVLPQQEEQRLGNEIMREIRQKERSYINDTPSTDYLNAMGRHLSKALDNQSKQQFRFFLLNDSSINAFALPGGYIGVHTGLIFAAENESELAGVLAHEISHVTQHHIARGIDSQKGSYATILASMALAIIAMRNNPEIAQGALIAGQAGAISQQLSYSRRFEHEADRIGLQLLTRAGYDPQGMESFFKRLQRHVRVYENSTTPSYLMTHPLTSERISDINNRLLEIESPSKLVNDQEGFLLVRSRLRALYSSITEALEYFRPRATSGQQELSGQLQQARTYGWALVLFRQNKFSEAAKQLEKMSRFNYQSPLPLLLKAKIKQKLGKHADSLANLQAAHQQYPRSRAITHALADAWLAIPQQSETALKFISEDIRSNPNDYLMRHKQAKANAMLGKRFQQHWAQGEAYALQGLLPLAIEQMELALKSPDGNYYQQAQVDVRLKALKKEYRQLRQDTR